MKTGVSYFARSRLKHMQEDMEEIKRNNCNFVVHTFSEQDLEFYKGTIQKLVEISKIAGLRSGSIRGASEVFSEEKATLNSCQKI